MRASGKVASRPKDEQMHDILVQVITDIRNAEEANAFLEDLLTPAERLSLVNRVGIAMFLAQGQSYDMIKQTLGVSSATIAKIQESLDRPGVRLAIQKIRIDQWAGIWAEKLSAALAKLMGK